MKHGKIALLIIAGLAGLFFARTPKFLGDKCFCLGARHFHAEQQGEVALAIVREKECGATPLMWQFEEDMKTLEKIIRHVLTGLAFIGLFAAVIGVMASYPLAMQPALVTGLIGGAVSVLLINAHINKERLCEYIGAIAGVALMAFILAAAPQPIPKGVLLLGLFIGAILVPFSAVLERFAKNGTNGGAIIGTDGG